MAKNYIIGIGGTGARVIESAVHLCAAGYGPDELSTFIVDPDQGNGNLTRTRSLMALYSECRSNFVSTNATDGKLFRTAISVPDPFVWHIFEERNSTLQDYINYTGLEEELSHFADILFTKQELEEQLNEGFRGHPSIGAVVMANPPEDENPWKMLWDDLGNKRENEVRVFLTGSVFGGTGAAGVPTFGSRDLIKFNERADLGDDKSSVLLGGALVLPYFSFEQDQTEDRLFVTGEDFPIATKAALHYYHDKELGFDHLYLIGDSLRQKVGNFSPGSKGQENRPHYVELVTALAAFDFFSQPPVEGIPEKKYFIASRENESVDWKSLPIHRDSKRIHDDQMELKSCLTRMATFAYAMNAYGRDILKRDHSDSVLRELTWYRQNFTFKEKKEKDRPKNPRTGDNKAFLDNIEKYLDQFLFWICSMDDDSQKVKLINSKKLFESPPEANKPLIFRDCYVHKQNFGEFLYEKSKGEDFDHFISQFLNDIDLTKEKSMAGANKFVNIFLEASMRFCSKNYNILKQAAE